MNWLHALRDAWIWFSSSVSVLSIFSENRRILFGTGVLLAVAVFVLEWNALRRGSRITNITAELGRKSFTYQFRNSIFYRYDQQLWLCYKDDEKCYTVAFGNIVDRAYEQDYRYFTPIMYFDEQQHSRPAPEQDTESQYFDLKHLYLSKTYIEYEGSYKSLRNQEDEK